MRRTRSDPDAALFTWLGGVLRRPWALCLKLLALGAVRRSVHFTALALLLVGLVALPGAQPPSGNRAVPGAFPYSLATANASPNFLRIMGNSHVQRSEHVWRTWRNIGGVGVNIVYVNTAPNSVRLVVGFGSGADPGHGYFPRENFYRIVSRYDPRVAINGTYFHLLNGQPTGSIVRNGTFLYDGRWGTTIALDRKGHVKFLYQSGTLGHDRGWRGVENAITTGPTLVRDGRLYMHAREEGFADPAVLGTARRSALGLTWDKRLVLVTVPTPVTLNKLGNIMLSLSCKAAANLDGGSSSALYCNGEFVTKPQRALSNVLLVYD